MELGTIGMMKVIKNVLILISCPFLWMQNASYVLHPDG
jgi:hypothetical protein